MCENKEIKDCVKELGVCYDKLHKCFCEGKLCTDTNIQKAEDVIKNSVDYIFEKINER